MTENTSTLANLLIIALALLLFATGPVAGQATLSMQEPNNWNLRLDGPLDTNGRSAALTFASLVAGDIDGNGRADLVVGARRADRLGGGPDAGALFIVHDSLLNGDGSISRTLDLSDPAQYSLRIDGAGAGHETGRRPALADLNDDQRLDLAFGSPRADSSGRPNGGAVYVILNQRLGDLSTSGRYMDLADPASYDLRYDGPALDSFFGVGPIMAADLDGDDRPELLASATGRPLTRASLYIFRNPLLNAQLGTVVDLADPGTFSIRVQGAFHPWKIEGETYQFGDAFWDALALADLDGDNRADITLGSPTASYNNRLFSGSIYVLLASLLDPLTGTDNVVDLASTSSYNLRIDGSRPTVEPLAPLYQNSGLLAYYGTLSAGDADGDGLAEIVVGEHRDAPGRQDAGAVYLLRDDLLASHLPGVGQTLDLANSSSFSIRFDGAEAGDRHVYGAQIRWADLDRQGDLDLLFSAVGDPIRKEDHPGKVYAFLDETLSSFTGTGNTVDLATVTPAFKYTGAADGDWLSASALELADVDGDGGSDLLIGAWGANTSEADSGALYLVLGFPHQLVIEEELFESTSGSSYDLIGEIDAESSASGIEAVEWSTSSGGEWQACAADDGAFDTPQETFRCTIDLAGPEDIELRARDLRGIQTLQEQFPSRSLTTESAIPKGVGIVASTDSITVTWSTKGPGSSQVKYGIGTLDEESAERDTAARVESHSLTVTGLQACTTYQVQPVSRDAAGNVAVGSTRQVQTTCELRGRPSAP